jgi:hypothetical protein
MFKAHPLQILRSLRREFLLWTLPLLLLGVIFWVGGDLLTKQLLSRPYGTLDKLKADTQLQVLLKLNVAVKTVEIEKEQEFTQFEVMTANSVLKKLEFELPIAPGETSKESIALSNPEEIAIAQQLEVFSQGEKLQGNQQLIVQLPVTLQIIKAEIKKERGLSTVEVWTANDILTKLEFEFPVIEVNMVEAMIAQELGLSRENVRKLVRYQIK